MVSESYAAACVSGGPGAHSNLDGQGYVKRSYSWTLDMGADDVYGETFQSGRASGAHSGTLLRRAQPTRPQVLRFADLSYWDTGTRQAHVAIELSR
jgi:hypothetical protein